MGKDEATRAMELPLERLHFDAARLIEEHSPRWRHRNKQAVFDRVRSAQHVFSGRLTYARWPAAQLPRTVTTRSRFRVCPGVFTYALDPTLADVEWHVNFADPHLFVAYGSPLLAQDELQVAEHPILGALRDALVSAGRAPETLDSRGRPTPITISGVQRLCAIDTMPNPEAGRPRSLYGNAFARASVEEVVAATKVLPAPSISNILAMAAPAGGYGLYTKDEIVYVATTAFTGFVAARRESETLVAQPSRMAIHSGFWGCGAFGGNRIMMTVLQAFAADLADVDVVFHAFDDAGVALAEDALRLYDRTRASSSSVSEILDAVLQRRFEWGESDGN